MALVKYLSSKTKPELNAMIEVLNLTDSEEEVFWLLSKGYSKIMICEKYGASPVTISRIIQRITDKIRRIEKADHCESK